MKRDGLDRTETPALQVFGEQRRMPGFRLWHLEVARVPANDRPTS